MPTDRLHPAIDIPGGLWPQAPVACERYRLGWGAAVTASPTACRVAHPLGIGDMYDIKTYPTEALSLRLDDPLGLGLAGLAVRVAERAGIAISLEMSGWGLALLLRGRSWAPPHWKRAPTGTVIREAATLTARLDRLTAAVWPGYRVEAGRVPVWERIDPWPDAPEEVNPHAGWRLTLHEAGRQYPRVIIWHDDVLGLDTPDPIEAAGAALEVCGG